MRRLFKKLIGKSSEVSTTEDSQSTVRRAATQTTTRNVKLQKNPSSVPKFTKGTTVPTPRASKSSIASRSTPNRYQGILKSGKKDYQKLRSDDSEDDGDGEPRRNVLLPQLDETETKFLEAVDDGDVKEATKLLSDARVNVNCVNYQGLTALHIAVENEDYEMVDFLLKQRNIDIGDSVLVAIKENYIDILKSLLKHLEKTAPGLESVGTTHSSDFPDYITPLILAAQCGHYEIIEFLIKRDHNITRPHPPRCLCYECKDQLQYEDLLRTESLRFNLYKAISNPAYICQTSDDPILTSFLLSVELRECAKVINAFRASYLLLAEEISTFAVELVGQCRTSAETELILRQKNGFEEPTSFPFPRLILAMDCKQKEFVSHQNTQQILESKWYCDWYEWKIRNKFYLKLFYPLFRIILLPVMAIMCLLTPKNKLVTHWQIPLNRMINYTSSYLIFLGLLYFESNLDKRKQKRGPPRSGLEALIIIYVLGYSFDCIRMCAVRGPKRFFKSLWGWHYLLMNIFFMITFAFWFVSYIDVSANGDENLERKFWHSFDPSLIAEGTFAIATITAWMKLLNLCSLGIYLGPLQIVLGKMGVDVAKYILIFFIIIISFTVGLCKFYQYYDGMVQVDETYEIKTEQVSSFVDFVSTLKTFFWAVFCMAPIESVDVVIENLPGPEEGTSITNHHTFTEAVGYISFAIFEFLTVIVILNMLIATMSHTFQRITDNIDIEWTFGKTEFYLEYMQKSVLPPPFNLFPTRNSISTISQWCNLFRSKGGNDGRRAGFNLLHCCYIDEEVDENNFEDFPILMSQLVQRYFREKSSAEESSSADDLEMIQKELQEIKKHIGKRQSTIMETYK